MANRQSLVTYAAFFGALAVILAFSGSDAVFAIVTGIIASVLFLLVQEVASNAAYRRYWIATLLHRREPYRMSMSYLVLVALEGDDDDQVLLVASRRFDHFQPVGGVYKFFPEAKAELERCGYEPDPLIPKDDASRDDLRLVVRGRHVLRFLRWFDSGRDRECAPWREFHEELIATDVLPPHEFGTALFRQLGRHYHPVRRPEYSGEMREILVADIFQLMPNARQAAALAALQAQTTNADILWLSKAAARRRGAGDTTGRVPSVSDHTPWLFDHSSLA
jgi:hypothetical protein